jgi:hypothetical protein
VIFSNFRGKEFAKNKEAHKSFVTEDHKVGSQMTNMTQTVDYIEIAGLKFTGKKSAYTHVRNIVLAHSPGDVLTGMEDRLFRAVVEMHPRAEEKIGIGIKRFIVDKALCDTLGVRFIRNDGSQDDLSIKKCFYGDDSPRRRVMRVMRAAVACDVAKLKAEWLEKYGHGCQPGKMRCAISKKYIRIDKGHMDHIPPMTFEVIATTFMAHKGLTFQEIEFAESGLNKELRMKSVQLENEFRQWHANLAQMRFIANTENHLDEALAKLRRTGLTINASKSGLRAKEQIRVRKMLYS